MRSLSVAIGDLQPEEVWRWSQPLLFGALALGVAVILFGAWQSTIILLVLGALLIGGLVFAVLSKHEVGLLCAILVAFVLKVGYDEGFQLEEVLFGAVYLSYLGYWFISRLFFYRDNILSSKLDWALFLFLIYATLSLGLTPILGGDTISAISQWVSVSILAFYFPVKEACIRRPALALHRPVLLSAGFVAVYVAMRNFLAYKRGIADAEYLWQIATGRVVMNEHILMMAGLVALVYLLHSRKKWHVVSLGILVTTFSAAVIIGLSRAVWVSYALGIAVIFLLVERDKKRQLILFGAASLAAVLLAGSLMFENFFTLIVAGLADRLLSLRSAASQDLSLINRFIEMDAAWQYIKQNPIVGHGFGVPIKYYSLVFEATRIDSFIHNGYIGVWYRHGLVGALLLFGFYFGCLWTAVRTVRFPAVGRRERVMATAACACLAAEALVGNSQNPFATSDNTFIVGIMTAFGAAAWHTTRRGIRHVENE